MINVRLSYTHSVPPTYSFPFHHSPPTHRLHAWRHDLSCLLVICIWWLSRAKGCHSDCCQWRRRKEGKRAVRRGEGRCRGGRRNLFKDTDAQRKAAPKMSEADQGGEVRVGLKSPIFDPKLAWAAKTPGPPEMWEKGARYRTKRIQLRPNLASRTRSVILIKLKVKAIQGAIRARPTHQITVPVQVRTHRRKSIYWTRHVHLH